MVKITGIFPGQPELAWKQNFEINKKGIIKRNTGFHTNFALQMTTLNWILFVCALMWSVNSTVSAQNVLKIPMGR